MDGVELDEYTELDLNGINIFFDGGADFDADNLTDGIIEAKAEATGKARFIKTLTRNNNMVDGEIFGVTENIPGDTTPISFPRNTILEEVQFQNNRTTDFQLVFRLGTLTATPFLTIDETGVSSASEININQAIPAGTPIFIEFVQTGQRIRDSFIDLYIRNE